MKAKITFMEGDWPSYYVENQDDCKDATDLSAYLEFIASGGQTIQMGKACVEKG